MMRERIPLKSERELQIMREGGTILTTVLQHLADMVKPGVSTRDLDAAAYELITERDAKPSFKDYKVGPRVYHASICASINEEVVHGIPNARRLLRGGDIIAIDVGVFYRGYHVDSAVTVPVGNVSPTTTRLLEATRDALYAGIEQCVVGKRVGDISKAVEQVAKSRGFAVVSDLVGHGVGKKLHEPPQVPNVFKAGELGPVLQPGMTLAIEPMVNQGLADTRTLPDGWTVVTADQSLSAHFEHTVAITEQGPLIITQGTTH